MEKLKKTKYLSHLTPKEHKKLISLIGKKCKVECTLNKSKTPGLWDTGAMVSALARAWLEKPQPEIEIRNLSELVDEPLDIKTANQNSMSCIGWVDLSFQIRNSAILQVPFLVMNDEIDIRIIGFNVIYELMKERSIDLVDKV